MAGERIGLRHRLHLRDQRFGERRFYRKTALFDRLLSFNVHLDAADTRRH